MTAVCCSPHGTTRSRSSPCAGSRSAPCGAAAAGGVRRDSSRASTCCVRRSPTGREPFFFKISEHADGESRRPVLI